MTNDHSDQAIPCFFSLLKKVLRGMSRSRAAMLLLPWASLRASINRWRSYETNSEFQSSPIVRLASGAVQAPGASRPAEGPSDLAGVVAAGPRRPAAGAAAPCAVLEAGSRGRS